ncbi:MAG: DUF3307 domain-containing protein [Hyphomicrobium sp.]|nr:DUF3307 domain-containing protein [Hyphomicrobium sp.]
MLAPVAQLSTEHAVLLAVAYLMVKHAVADFLLQSARQRIEKGIYGKLGGFTHALTHSALTAPVFVLLPFVGPTIVLALLIAEFVIHYHIDWAKEQLVRQRGWTSKDTAFWWAFGIDQMLHGLTYVALLWVAYPA